MRSVRIHLCITGVIMIVLGVLTLRYPIEAIMSAGSIIGIGLVVSGANHFSGWYFFRLRRFIVMGILDLIAGIVMISQPGITAFILPFVIGLWLFSSGISRTCIAFWLGGAGIPGWWFMLLNGLAMIAFAVMMCISPLSSALSVMMVLAVVLIASGVLTIAEGFAVPN